MEYLLQSGMTASNITNQLTAIRSLCIIYNCDYSVFRDKRIPLFIKAIEINRPLQPKLNFVIDENILYAILSAAAQFQKPNTLIALYLLACFFLRLSSILPHSVNSFDSSRHLCVGNIIFGVDSAVILNKWSKTLQDRATVASVSLPSLGVSPLYPVVALHHMLSGHQYMPNEPLFQDRLQRVALLQILWPENTLRLSLCTSIFLKY